MSPGIYGLLVTLTTLNRFRMPELGSSKTDKLVLSSELHLNETNLGKGKRLMMKHPLLIFLINDNKALHIYPQTVLEIKPVL